ncbi:hypothetical protein BGZ63DRAFT_391156 [Mariannaea sp. PMI_226]|nr:hypothetical protein BGZ63DRAFT_391156 [Mariannaea sp. PMI_226]
MTEVTSYKSSPMPLVTAYYKQLSEIMESITRKHNRTNKNFSRAIQHLMKRYNQMSRHYGTDIYIQARRNHQHYNFISTSNPSFPLATDALVSLLFQRDFFSLTVGLG